MPTLLKVSCIITPNHPAGIIYYCLIDTSHGNEICITYEAIDSWEVMTVTEPQESHDAAAAEARSFFVENEKKILGLFNKAREYLVKNKMEDGDFFVTGNDIELDKETPWQDTRHPSHPVKCKCGECTKAKEFLKKFLEWRKRRPESS